MAEFDLQSLLICPNRELANAFLEAVPALRVFQILSDLKSYPTDQALEMRLRQLEPDVVLLDLTTDPTRAGQITEYVTRAKLGTQVVGLHLRNDSEALVDSLRKGASEFLYAPFTPKSQQEAIGRIRRLLRSKAVAEREAGQVVCFASAKPGAGASTIALETALALERQSSARILLIDGDLAGGTVAAASETQLTEDNATLASVLSGAAGPNWPRRTLRIGGIELLPSPPEASTDPVDLSRLSEVFDSARRSYDWVVVDLPSVYERLSLMAVAAADVYFLVTTGELPSLHLGRRALGLLQSLGFAKNAARILVNRLSRREGLGPAELEKIFSVRVDALLPQDCHSIHRRASSASGAAQPLSVSSDLGKAIQSLATKLTAAVAEKSRVQPAIDAQPA